MSRTFYDRNGAPAAYLDDDGEHIYAFDGRPLAYVDGEHVYNFDGKFVAWSNGGWLRDIKGDALLFTDEAEGGPLQPFKQFEPFRGFKQFLPFKGFKEFAPFKPFFTFGWSPTKFW